MSARLTLSLAALPLLASAVAPALWPGPSKVVIEYRPDQSYEMTVQKSLTLRLGESSMIVGGEEYPADMMGATVPDRDETQTIILRDEVREAADGRPILVAREFVELTKESTESDEETKDTGELEGSTLLLNLGEDDVVEAAPEDDAEGGIDEVYLTGHIMLHPAVGILPEDPVEPGDTWSPSDEAIRHFLLPNGPEYYDMEESPSLTEILDEEADVTAEATYRERVMLDKIDCYVIDLEAEVEAYINELPEEFQSGGAEEKEGSIEVKGEFTATLWVSVETNFPVKLEVESDITFDVEMLMEHQGMGIEINLELLVKGTTETSWE